MLGPEKYKKNIDKAGTNDLQDIEVHKSLVFNKTLEYFREKKNEDISNVPSLASAIIGVNNTATPFTAETKHLWTDIDVHEAYLSKKPTCYLILGKPGLGTYSLGEAVSKKFNCVHLCPINIIIDEIDQGSSTGKCIDHNLRHTKVLDFKIILTMIKIKLESPAVQHRGYIISGLPIVTNTRDEKYLTETLIAEESLDVANDINSELLLQAVQKKKRKTKARMASEHSSVSSQKNSLEEQDEEQEEEGEPEILEEVEAEEVAVELPKFILNTCSDVIHSGVCHFKTKKGVLLKQIDEILNLRMKPDYVFCITASDNDTLFKKEQHYFDYLTSTYLTKTFPKPESSETRWPTLYSITDFSEKSVSYSNHSKYHCKNPINFKDNAAEQLCNYHIHVQPYVEKRIRDLNPKCVIKIDGYLSIREMLQSISERLLLLPIEPVLIPVPLYLEEENEDLDEFWKTVKEQNAIQSDMVNFERCPSPWFNRCPVKLKQRKSVVGKIKFAVSFLNHVYLLSSLDCMVMFCRNPRPFLKISLLEPTCRIFVIGTRLSGKTMTAKCLSWLFDAPIVCYKTLLMQKKERKYNTFATRILSEIIATIEDDRLGKWEHIEEERKTKLLEWQTATIDLLKKYINVYQELNALAEEEQSDISKLLKKKQFLEEQLRYIPFLEDIALCKSTIKNKDKLLAYADTLLITETEEPKLPILGDADVTEAIDAYIINNELQNEIEPTSEELVNEVINTLSNFDLKSENISKGVVPYGKWIVDDFPSDPEFWQLLEELQFFPDYTIAINEKREIEEEIIKHYESIQKSFKIHEERFLLAKDPLLDIRYLSKSSTKCACYNCFCADVQLIVHDFANYVLDNLFPEESAGPSEGEKDFGTILKESFDKFNEDWESIKVKLEENMKSFIEVEIQDRSDIQIVEEIILQLRKCYYLQCIPNEDEEIQDEEDDSPKDMITYNSPRQMSETSVYCPVAYYDYGVLWEGKPELCLNFNNKVHNFSKEECMELFQKDPTKYQAYNKPIKQRPPIRICVIGCLGSGKTTISKFMAKELNVLHIDFSEYINEYFLPKHYKKVGRQYENSFTDELIDDENITEFQMGEDNDNLETDIMSNETELRKMIYNYFERGSPILSLLMQKMIKRLWFEEPFLSKGFILDGFPKLPTDFEDMISCFCIPDMVILLESTVETTLDRLAPLMFRTWKIQLNEAKNKARMKLDTERKTWMALITKQVVVKLIICEAIDNALVAAGEHNYALSTESVIIDSHPLGPANVDVNLFNYFNEMIEEYPEPVDENQWEKADEIREKINSRLESIYEVDDENLQNILETLAEQKIKMISLNASKSLTLVFRKVLSNLSTLKNRNESYLEQTYVINNEIAQVLLSEGFFFLSELQRMCPVYIFENPQTITNPLKIFQNKGKIFSVVHRSYIYFLYGEENVKKFRMNPLKYLIGNSIKSFNNFPISISVIGPPKSGKSTLASKLAKLYGLTCLSKGMAIRHIMESMRWTKLASIMRDQLDRGDCISQDDIIQAVQIVAMDNRTMTYGFIFDGFPDSPSEALSLHKLGLYPFIILDLSTKKESILKNSQNEIHLEILKYMPPYSSAFIENRYLEFNSTCKDIRNWINNEFQNKHDIEGYRSRWQCFQTANNIVLNIKLRVYNYIQNFEHKAVAMDDICISRETFEQGQSKFKNMCPLCYIENKIRHNGFPGNMNGIIQYQNRYYWVCSEHTKKVLANPDAYLSTRGIHIPEIPVVVNTINVSEVYENGVCIVTYAENLPGHKIKIGNKNFAASFKQKTYFFCSNKCLHKFLEKPHLYFDITVFKDFKLLPEITLKSLPHLGYLEQTIGNLITEACCNINVVRPKYPGLDIRTSGVLHIALFLKLHNPHISKESLSNYDRANKLFEARCKIVVNVGLRMRSMDNPFAQYPRCCNYNSMIINNNDSGTVDKPSTISSGTDEFATYSLIN